MKKINLSYYSSKVEQILNKGQFSTIFLLKDGRILKLYNQKVIILFKQMGYDIEKIVLESEKYNINSNIKKPLEIIYANNMFCGYIMNLAKGISFNERNENLSIEDRINLYKYATLHNNIEKIVKESEEIVFPDLLTCDNIFVDEFLNVELIDFDGLQLKNNRVLGISTSLGSEEALIASKKYFNNQLGIFTKELDIKSLTYLYFLDAFNIDLNKVGLKNPYTNKIVTLEYIFAQIQLDDYDIMHKVWKLYQEKEKNEYLGEDVFEIAERYNMTATQTPFDKNIYLKKLIKK